jgi:hypothetical protein
VLLLASGDLLSALYSLTRDAGRRLPACFFVNDIDRHLLAGNVMLLRLAHHAPAAHVFSVWFSLGLSAPAHASLHAVLDALTGPSSTDHLSKIGVEFWRLEDHRIIDNVLRDWKRMQLEWEGIQARRREVLHWFIKKETLHQGGSLTWWLHLMWRTTSSLSRSSKRRGWSPGAGARCSPAR